MTELQGFNGAWAKFRRPHWSLEYRACFNNSVCLRQRLIKSPGLTARPCTQGFESGIEAVALPYSLSLGSNQEAVALFRQPCMFEAAACLFKYLLKVLPEPESQSLK